MDDEKPWAGEFWIVWVIFAVRSLRLESEDVFRILGELGNRSINGPHECAVCGQIDVFLESWVSASLH